MIDAKQKDIAWSILRNRHVEPDRNNGMGPQTVPGWSGFNAAVSMATPVPCVIGYCPVIEASPTELSTVYTILKRSVEMGRKLNLEEVIVVMDQAIYAKAQEVVWKKSEEFNNVVLRLGTFHTTMTFMSVIGDAGLSDILVQSGIVAAGSVSGVLEGHKYNRSLRTHKIVMEAMQRLRLKSF